MQESDLEAALMGGHGCAVSVMLALGGAELAAAAGTGEDPAELANFWYFPGDFVSAVRQADAVALNGEPVLNAIARLAVTYREETGEVLYRLACERDVLMAHGNHWGQLSVARRRAWELFATVSNRVYAVLEATQAQGADVLPPPAIAAVAETIFAEDAQGDADADRVLALELIAQVAAGPAVVDRGEPAEAEADLLSIARAPAIDLPAECPVAPSGQDPGGPLYLSDPSGAAMFTATGENAFRKGERVWRELEGRREQGVVLTAHKDGRYRVDVEGVSAHATWDPDEAPIYRF